MNRTVFGAVLLLALLAAGITASVGLSRQSEAAAAQLETAARQAMVGNLPEAEESAQEARESWDKSRHIQAVFSDHGPLDAIDKGFALLQLYGAAGDEGAYGAQCVALAAQFTALGEENGLQWWNIF